MWRSSSCSRALRYCSVSDGLMSIHTGPRDLLPQVHRVVGRVVRHALALHRRAHRDQIVGDTLTAHSRVLAYRLVQAGRGAPFVRCIAVTGSFQIVTFEWKMKPCFSKARSKLPESLSGRCIRRALFEAGISMK